VLIKSKITTTLLLLVISASCGGGGAESNKPATTSSTPAAAAEAPAASASTPSEGQVANGADPAPSIPSDLSLETPAEAYKAAYVLRKNGDVEGLKQVMSRELIQYFTQLAQSNGSTLDKALSHLVKQPQAPAAETRNVRINGDHAILEYKDRDGKWLEMDFKKEGGGWKMALSKTEVRTGENNPQPKR
jgi:cytoskeletal protein RodZ